MIIQTLSLENFRIYQNQTFTFHPTLNIIIGNNAQGKTSVLEALHTLALTKSHKMTKDVDMIKNNAEYAKISSQGTFDTQPIQFQMVLSKNGKKVKYNKIEISRLSDYIGYFKLVMFAPEDLNLIKGSPQERRRFLDLEIGQMSKSYLVHLSHYRRLLKERNEVLKSADKKQKLDETLLEVITEQMIHYAEKIIKERKQFIEKININIKEILPKLGEFSPDIHLMYMPSIETNLQTGYKKKEKLDLLTKTTNVGPHRDDFVFHFGEKLLKHVASQGQIRTLILALKISVVEMIKNHTQSTPIILLDDVFSELDASRQQFILEHLGHQAQVFITTTDLNNIQVKSLSAYQIIEIDAGKIKGVKTYG